MSTTPFRYMAVDLITGAIVGRVPLSDVSFTSVLNGAGPMTASLKLPVDDLELANAYVDATEELRRAIYIEYDGAVVWAGPIWATDYDTDTQTLKLTGAELWSYWRRRRIRWNADYTSTDQLAIARALLGTAQAALGGNLGLILPITSSGVLRDRTYREFEDKQLGEAIEQLSDVQGGFDFATEVVRLGSVYKRTWRTYFPEKGNPVETSGLILTLGNNMLRLQLPRNGVATANSVMTQGAGEGLDMLRATSTDLDALDDGYPLLEDSKAFKDVKLQSTLSGHAQTELAARHRPVSLPRAVIRADTAPVFGTYGLGDQALLRVLPATEPRWLNGVELEARLTSYSVKPPDDGDPITIDLTFEEIAA